MSTVDLKNARNDYYLHRLNAVRDPKVLCSELRCLGLMKSNLPSSLQFFQADVLNEYYVSVSSASPTCTYDDSDSIVARPGGLAGKRSFEFDLIDVETV